MPFSLSQIRCILQMPANSNDRTVFQRNFALSQISGDISFQADFSHEEQSVKPGSH